MSTLTDFLLARIAEDKAVANEASEPDTLTGEARPYYSGMANQQDDWGLWSLRVPPARVLAECEAKRRIVVRCQEMLTAAVPMAVHLAQQTLTDLARPHADHPDYRQEWKP